MLEGSLYAQALPEWLQAAAGGGLRAPTETLPGLLDAGYRDRKLRDWLLPVIGSRGRWLALQNPQWAYAVEPPEDEETWETGEKERRIAFLRNLRRKDPARARELLASTWKTETGADRPYFLEALSINLSMEDEPFLESALDARQQKTRRAAAELLARLPESRLHRRVLDRLLPLLSIKRGLIGGDRIEVTPPVDCDSAMTRDGIHPTPPEAMGKSAWWLCEMVGLMPPGLWPRLWNKTPEEIIRAGAKSEWRDALLTGWRDAARRIPDGEWAEAITRWWYLSGEKAMPPGANAAHLLHCIPPTRLEKVALESFDSRREPIHDEHPALTLLKAHLRPWSAELSRAVLASYRRRIAEGESRKQSAWDARSSLKAFALYMPAAIADTAAEGWPSQSADWGLWEKSVDEFLSLLRFRRGMLARLTRKI